MGHHRLDQARRDIEQLKEVLIAGEDDDLLLTHSSTPIRSHEIIGLDIRGLMAVGPTGPPEAARPGFRALAALADRLELPVRSMGMTDPTRCGRLTSSSIDMCVLSLSRRTS